MPIAMNVVTGLQSWASGRSFVAHTNLLEGAVMDASSVSGDFAADLAASWFAGDQKWKASAATSPQWLRADLGAAMSVNCFCLYGTNLGTIGATVSVQYADALAGPWTTAGDSFMPTTDRAYMQVFDATIISRYWRFLIENPSAAPVIAVAFIGFADRVWSGPPDGFRPPHLDREDEVLNNRSDGGEFLGRSLIRTGGRGEITVKYAPPAWMRETWEPVRLAARLHPIFYGWNVDSYPDESVLFFTDKPDRGPSYMSGGFYMQHTMTGIALSGDD